MAGRIVTVSQQKGGSGKTTLAAHLAVAWALGDGRAVAILDVDPQGSLGEWLEKREHRLGEAETGLSFRTASGWGARREARALARDHDVVVIDTPPHADLEARTAMDAADLVLVPVQPTPMDIWSTAETLRLADKERVPVLLVLNRVPPRARLTEEMVRALAEAGHPVTRTRVGNRVAFAAALGQGLTVLEARPKAAKAADEISRLAREICDYPPAAP